MHDVDSFLAKQAFNWAPDYSKLMKTYPSAASLQPHYTPVSWNHSIHKVVSHDMKIQYDSNYILHTFMK